MSCGNCAYNCCCRCDRRDECRICKIDRCGHGPEYPTHHLCLSCMHSWKTREGNIVFTQSGRVDNKAYVHDKRDIKKRQKYTSDEKYNMKPTACAFCGDPGIIVGINFRTPKHNDNNAWKLLHKLINSSYDDLNKMQSDKNEKFVYLYSQNNAVEMHDYEERWKMTDKRNPRYPRIPAIIFGDDHISKYYSYPTKLREYPHFLKEVKDGRKYFFTKSQRWKMVRCYFQIMSVVKYWMKYSHNKRVIRDVLNIEPLHHVIEHFNEFETIIKSRHKISLPKDILFVICKKLFQ